ncbi:MAG: HAD family hydrolase [Cyanobacteria bacterium P01_A01_bin.135]
MPNSQLPDLLAFDFDGVICDGLVEYFQTAWRAYCRIWGPADETPPEGLAEHFYPLRPVIESGWEMPVLLRSLLQGTTDEVILANWPAIARDRIAADGVDSKDLAAAVDRVRDEWIQGDLGGWLSQHRFYPGMVELLRRLLQSDTYVVIITTKEGRFAKQLLAQAGVAMPEGQICGKEVKRPKYETLRDLIAQQQAESVWFIEDRLKALLGVAQQPDLSQVRLLLADWGYNTEADRQQGRKAEGVEVVGIEAIASVGE